MMQKARLGSFLVTFTIFVFSLTVMMAVYLASPSLVFAQTSSTEESVVAPTSEEPDRSCVDDSFLGLPTWYKYLEKELDSSGRCSPVIEDANAALPIGIAVLEIGLRLAGVVAVAMVFVGSFRFIASAGNGDAAAGARKTVINAIIGLIIVVMSTAIINFLGRTIVG
jgi:hypothetical protein